MTRPRFNGGGLARTLGSLLFGSLALGCAPARAPLPPTPAAAAPEQLARWHEPPPVSPEERGEVKLEIRRVKLPNGVGVTVAVRPGTATSLELRVPSARDPSQGPITAMINSLRAGTRDGARPPFFNPKIALSPIGFWTDSVGTTFVWRVPQQGTRQALSLLGSFVLEPAFEKNEVQLQFEQQLASIRDASQPLTQMLSLTRAEIPGLQRPSPEDDARGLFRLSPAVLPQIHRCAMHPEGSELVVVGPVDPDAVVTWATNALGKWKAEPVAAETCSDWLTPAVPEQAEAGRLDRPRLLLIFGLREDPWLALDVPGPAIGSADYLPFEMLSKVLAERSAGSAKELRHAGATYGIHFGTYDRYPGSSLLEVRGQLEAERAQGALRSLVEDIRSIAQHLDAADLEAVKRRWRTETVDSWSHGPGLAGAIQWQLRRGGAPEDLAKILDEGQQIDVARCREVADRYLTQAQPSMALTGLTQNLIRGLAIDADVQQLAWTNQIRVHKNGR